MNDMCMRNVLIFGIFVSAVAASAVLLSGCETYRSERSYQVVPGPPLASERVVVVVPEQGRPGYDRERHDDNYRRDENRRLEEKKRLEENARHEENGRHNDNVRHDDNGRHDETIRHDDNVGHESR
jgi:hypothetical protein